MVETSFERYRRAKIALLTGWQLEYIDSLGILDQDDVLQVWESEQALLKVRQRKR